MSPPAYLSQVDAVLASVVRFLIGFVGIAFVVMLLFSGYSYISAGGNKEAIAKAQHSFRNAFIGLVVTLAAWIIVSLTGTFLGINLGNFSICVTAGCN